MGSTLRQLRALVNLIVLAGLSVTHSITYAVPPPMERPAVVAEKATKGVLLAVTRAGQRIIAVGERGIVLLSDDNGTSWRQAVVPVSVGLTGVRFVTPQRGWAIGHSGIVLGTLDGGETWSKQLDGKLAAQLTLDYFQQKTSHSDGAPGILKDQLDAAKQLVQDGADKPFLDLYFSNETTGFVVGAYNLIFRTEDGGKTWHPWQDHLVNPNSLHLYAIGGNESVIYIAGEQGSIFRSIDNGRTFTVVPNLYKGSYFGLFVEPKGTLLVFGLRGNVFRTADLGVTWQKVNLGSEASVPSGTRTQDGRLILVNKTGELLVSRDEGLSFQSTLVSSAPLTGVAEANNGSLVLVGLRGVTIRRNP